MELMERVMTCFDKFCGTGMMMALFLLSLLFLFLKEKNKTNRLLFVYVPFVTLLLYFCPLWAWVVYTLIGEDLYWRFLWLLPVVPVICFAGIKAVNMLEKKLQPVAGTALVVIFILSGSLIYQSSHVEWAENPYHIPQEVIEVCDMIQPKEGKVKAAFPWEMFQYVRQYAARIEMPYGREYILFPWADRCELYYALAEDTLSPERVSELARKEKCRYLVFSDAKKIDGNLEDYGYTLLCTIRGYCIYEDTCINE